MKKTKLLIFTVTLALICQAGCRSKSQLPGLVPAEGTVVYNGEPLAGASVTFHPVVKDADLRGASTITDQNGKFKLMTLNPGDGIAPGDYVVTVVKSERPAPPDEETARKMMSGLIPPPPLEKTVKHLINPKYAGEKTSDVTVTIGPKGDKKIEIRLDK